MRPREAALSIFIVSIFIVIIMPPPIWLLNVLLVISIFIGFLLLLNAIFAREPLQMSFFPTMLLVATMFRMVLNISTTRQILGTGNAGEVIDVFAQFVAGGNMVVGAIMFIIIIIVNLMVITKGAGRVAEVSARFTLDAMPGKQMAIDADLNTGLINEDEAKARRKKISDEAAFFGSMDGAAKFVQGDAVAGILITAINFIGGMALGALGLATGTPLPMGEAATVYGLLTIGDGLVGQIPAIMISFATGLLVTKASGETDVSTALIGQLFANPMVMYISGVFFVFLGVFAHLPPLLFVPAGLGMVAAGYFMSRKKQEDEVKEEASSDDSEVDAMRKPESVTPFLVVDPIMFQFGYGLIPYVETSQGGDIIDRFAMIRRSIALELGVIVPTIRLKDDIRLSPNEYIIKIKDVPVAKGEILFDHYMAMNLGYVEDEIDGIETEEPYFHTPALWIAESQRERAEALGYSVVDPPAIMTTHLAEIVKEHLHELLTRQDVQMLINNVKEKNEVLIDEVSKLLSIGDVQKVLSNLLRERVSIRDLVTILETLADNAALMRDPDMLTERVREALRRSISKQYFTGDVNTVITLDPGVEQLILDNMKQSEHGSYLSMDPVTVQKIFDRLRVEMTKLTSMGLQPIIMTSPIVRTYFKRLIETFAPDLVVLGYNEMDSTVEVQSVGVVSI